MQPESRRFLYAVILAAVTLGSSFLLLGWPWQRSTAATSTVSRHRAYRHGWYYHSYGGGHGGWVGRGFGWGTFGEFGGDGGGFRGGGPGFGK